MSVARAFGAAMCALLCLLAVTPPPARGAAQSAFESSGALPGGGLFVMRRDAVSATSAIEIWFRAPADGYDGKYPGISRLALAALAASAPPHGTSLADLVTREGGTLSINVYPDLAMIGASVPAWQAGGVLHAMTSTYFDQAISPDGLKAALRDSAIAAAESQFNPQRQLQNLLFAQIFAAGPAHYPPLPETASAFAEIPSEAISAFAARAFRQQNAVLSLAGGVDATLLADVSFGATGAPMDAPIDSPLARSFSDLSRSAAVDGLGFAWVGPPIADKKAATALDFIADYLFDANHGTVAVAARRESAHLFVGGQFITLHDPGVMLVTVSGSASAQYRGAVLAAVAGMSHPMETSAFDAARSAFEYHILSQVQTPQSLADNFGWYAAEGDLAYAPGDDSGEYMREAASLDPAYIAQIAQRYLQHPVIVQLTTAPKPEGSAT